MDGPKCVSLERRCDVKTGIDAHWRSRLSTITHSELPKNVQNGRSAHQTDRCVPRCQSANSRKPSGILSGEETPRSCCFSAAGPTQQQNNRYFKPLAKFIPLTGTVTLRALRCCQFFFKQSPVPLRPLTKTTALTYLHLFLSLAPPLPPLPAKGPSTGLSPSACYVSCMALCI